MRVKKEFPLNMNGGGTRLGGLAIAAGAGGCSGPPEANSFQMHSEHIREAVLYSEMNGDES